MAISGGNLRTTPSARIYGTELHRSRGIVEGVRSDRFGMLLRIFEQIDLIRRRRWRGQNGRAAGVLASVESDVTIEAERLRDFIAEVRADALAGYAPHHLANQESDRQRVITVLRSRR